jgi:hypothetical protein
MGVPSFISVLLDELDEPDALSYLASPCGIRLGVEYVGCVRYIDCFWDNYPPYFPPGAHLLKYLSP